MEQVKQNLRELAGDSHESIMSAVWTVLHFTDESKKLLSKSDNTATFSDEEMSRFFNEFDQLAETFKDTVTHVTDHSCNRPVLGSFALPSSPRGCRSFLPINGTHVALPGCYENRMVAALLYLLMHDAVKGFQLSPTSRIEIPCLIEYFASSTFNNQNNMGSLLEEYVMCVKICWEKKLFGEDIETFYCQTREKEFDFHTTAGGTETDYSVKSVDFTEEKLKVRRKRKRKRKEEEEINLICQNEKPNAENIVLHNCLCSVCHSRCVETVEIDRSKGGVKGIRKECESFKEKKKVLKSARSGRHVVHFVSTPFLFEVRRILYFVQQTEVRDTDENFPLRAEIICKLRSLKEQPADPEFEKMKVLVEL